MAKVFPGGTSVTRSFPPGFTADTSLWTVEYQADFAQHFAGTGAHDFTSDSTEPINGVTWTAYNSGAADKFEISAAGLEIDPKGDGTHLWAQNDDSAYLAAKLTDMMTGLGEDDTVALQLHMDCSPAPAAQWDAYGLALWNGVTSGGGTTKYVAHRYVYGSGPALRAESFSETATGGSAAQHYDSLVQATAQTFFEIVLYPGNGVVANMGVFDTAFPDPLTTSGFQTYTSISAALGPGGAYTNAVPTWNIPLATASFMIHAQRTSSATVLTTTSYKMRVLRRKNS
jgi:hypothetical protein